MSTHKKIVYISAAITLFILGGIFFVKNTSHFAAPTQNIAAIEYQPLTGGDVFGQVKDPNKQFETFMENAFKWGIAIALILAVLFIVLGAIQYMTTDAVFEKEEGKEKIMSALGGLILALVAWLILSTINPQLLNTNPSRNASSSVSQ